MCRVKWKADEVLIGKPYVPGEKFIFLLGVEGSNQIFDIQEIEASSCGEAKDIYATKNDLKQDDWDEYQQRGAFFRIVQILR